MSHLTFYSRSRIIESPINVGYPHELFFQTHVGFNFKVDSSFYFVNGFQVREKISISLDGIRTGGWQNNGDVVNRIPGSKQKNSGSFLVRFGGQITEER